MKVERKLSVLVSVLMLTLLSTIPKVTASNQNITTPHSRENLNALRALMPNAIEVKGKLKVVSRPTETWIVLHAEDGTMYLLIGGLLDKARKIIEDLGIKNIVKVSGYKNKRDHIVCDISYKFDENNNRLREAKCIKYYELDAYDIVPYKGTLTLSPPKRARAEEEKALRTALYNNPGMRSTPSLTEKLLGQAKGTIISVNTSSPIKTVSIETYSHGKQIIRHMIISSKTVIVRKVGSEEPMSVSSTALKEGQKVQVVYSRDEFKTEALFITITSE